ncbi:MAG: DNA polymerase III subunit delta [Pelagibacterales bacterium MED-G40]|nr:MAG: DNA polymerase III subunit delta [Pelagibacterales bacterium MED-G40]|tara:strand:+ start:25595 stop:26599 length:1005 start_codon:yes stop_codon:yes gene_type:complete
MILKSYIIEKDHSILSKFKSVLMYGENNGIKDDIKEKILKDSKNSEVINLFHEEIYNNKKILDNFISNSSLFSKKKIIFIHEVSDKIFEEIFEALNDLKEDVKIFIFSNQLEKRSKLRAHFEKIKDLGIIACYQDNEITLRNYINSSLITYKGLTPEITNLIMINSNKDRKTIKSEIKKIKSFFNKKLINKIELEELLNIKTNSNFSEITDAALNGDKNSLNKLMGEVEFLQEETFFYLNLISNKIFKLLEIKLNSTNPQNEIELVEGTKSKIFWKDRPIFLAQLKKWNHLKLEEALKKIIDIELAMKSNSLIKKDVLIKDLLIKLCGEASTSA